MSYDILLTTAILFGIILGGFFLKRYFNPKDKTDEELEYLYLLFGVLGIASGFSAIAVCILVMTSEV